MTIATSQQIGPEAATSPWTGFRTGLWQEEINVRDFIQTNYESYEGDDSFLAPATDQKPMDTGGSFLREFANVRS
jgi:pyruvate-formate lyase